MDSSILTEVGLTKKEADVYLALLSLGSSSASSIIQKTGFHRAVVYDLLERLIEKGLVGFAIKGRKKFFETTDPHRLIGILREKESKIMNILPQLSELSQFKERLDVKIYKGKEGIKTVLEDVLRVKPKEWLVLGSGGETYKLLPAFLDELHRKRVKAKIKARGLFIDNTNGRKRGEVLAKQAYTKIEYLPKNFLTPTVINIYGNRVALYSVTSNNIPFVIMIEAKQLTQSFIEYFEWAWQLSKNQKL